MRVQLLQKQVPAANQSISLTDELDKDYKHLTGIAILDSASADSILTSCSVGNSDIKKLPKGMEANYLLSNSNVPPNFRFFDLNEKADGEKINIDFVDGGQKGSYPYNLVIYLRLENCKK